MASLDEELLLDSQTDAEEVAYIRQRLSEAGLPLPDDDDIYYLIDLLAAYYAESGILEGTPDGEGYIDIPMDAVAEYVERAAPREIGKTFPPDLIACVAEADLEFAERQD